MKDKELIYRKAVEINNLIREQATKRFKKEPIDFDNIEARICLKSNDIIAVFDKDKTLHYLRNLNPCEE